MNPSFFTRPSRYKVPHERIGLRWLLLVHECVARAFALMRERGIDVSQCGENAITYQLEDILRNDLLRAGDETSLSDFFCDVTRGSETENHSGEKISKKPDLVFHLQRENRCWDRRQDALFAECKPVDKKHSLNGHYCAVGTDRNGIERFVIGDYAWAMQEAMMIGYVRDGLSILPHLADALAQTSNRAKLGEPTAPVSVGTTSPHQLRHALHKTTHRRSFAWRDGSPATPIDIFHSWHDCD